MPYPMEQAKIKHDLLTTQPIGDHLSCFASSTEMFQSLSKVPPPNSAKSLCSVYSYSDGPDYPGPLSRELVVQGFADSSISLIRTIAAGDVPDCLHKCTIAVKLADAKHAGRLDPKSLSNSKIFAKTMIKLRQEETVAVLGRDKHGRFGLLMPEGEPNGSKETYMRDDFVASCYVGDVNSVLEYLTQRNGGASTAPTKNTSMSSVPWEQPASDPSDAAAGLWKPPGSDNHGGFNANGDSGGGFDAPWDSEPAPAPWETSNGMDGGGGANSMPWDVNGDDSKKRSFDDMNNVGGDDHDDEEGEGEGDNFHADTGAAAADAFYSGLTRSLDTRSASRLYHMRAFNGWVKATQIQELDPRVTVKGRLMPKAPLRVLDLACGKGGDLTKWTLHDRGMSNYVGVDVARGSLRDAAIRAREMRKRNKLHKAVFTCADLGADVPGRKRTPDSKSMQKLSSWSLGDEPSYESGTPEFKFVRGGGISESDRFDVVSIQFAIHYMMSSGKRARRFFHTVSELLEVGGNLICTTIDARVVIDKLIDLGLDYHFDNPTQAKFTEATVTAGAGACRIKFEPEIVQKLFATKSDGSKADDDLFGLEYSFTLVEGSDHAAGVGDAVNLPEWLTPLPVLESLAKEAGLELEYAQNFHEFYLARRDSSEFPAAHHALYNMKVLNRSGTISEEEWSVSRLYAAIKFRKVRESTIVCGAEDSQADEQESDHEEEQKKSVELDPIKAKKMVPMAMMKAKRAAGTDRWNTLSSDEKNRLMQIELEKMAAK